MATVVIQFKVNAGATQTGVADVVAEDEITLLASSYAGWLSARWEIQSFPADFPCPTDWSTDPDSGVYYYNSSAITGIAPPVVTMPTALQIAAGQWGKWIFRVVVVTAAGTITSDPRVMVRIESPMLGLKGIGYTEGNESNATQAWPGDLQADLAIVDSAALVSGGFVSAATATRPIKVSGSTGAVNWTWEPNANVSNLGYGFTNTPSVTNGAGALALTAGGGAASLAGSTTATVSANGGLLTLEGVTAALTASGGNITADASAVVIVGGTTATRVDLGRSGQDLRLKPIAGSGVRIVAVDADGDVASPGADASMGGYKITSLGTPSATGDAATKGYVDSVAQGLDIKASVLVATTANITLSGTQTIDGVSVTATNRVLVKDQSTASENGIYVCAVGAWARADDMAAASSAAGAFCFVEEGTTNADKGFVCTSNVGSDVVGTNNLAFTQFTGAGGGLNALAKVLENDTTALGTNGVPIKALPATLEFISTAISEILTARASGVAVDDVVTPIVAEAYPTGGVGDVGLGVGFMSRGRDAGGNLTDFAHIVPIVTDATSTTLDATLYFQVANNGALVNAATLDNTGLLTTLGGMTAGGDIASGASSSVTAGTGGFVGPQINRASSGAFAFGSNITSITATAPATLTQTALGTTKTRGLTLSNTTVSGTQHPAQYGWTAFHSGGTQINAGLVMEPQSASRMTVRIYYGTGSGVPASGSTYWDSQDSTFSEGWISPGFYVGSSASGGSGFRFKHSNNNGGLDFNSGTDAIRIKSYNDKAIEFELDADSGGTGGVTRLSVSNIGSTTWHRTAAGTVTEHWGTSTGNRYHYTASAVFSANTTNGDYETAFSYTLPDNCTAICVYWVNALDTTSGDAAGYGKRRTVKRWAGGAATTVGSERDLGTDDEDDATWAVRTNVTGNTTYLEVDGDGTNVVKFAVHVDIYLMTSSA